LVIIPSGHCQINWDCWQNRSLKEFTTEMVSVLINEGESFVSQDVVSLFTNTPGNKALDS